MTKQGRILLYGSNLWYLAEGMFGPLFALYASDIGGNVLDITWAWAAYLFLAGVISILIGQLSDKQVKKEYILVVGYALNTLFTFAYLFVDSPFDLLVVQAGLGVASALATPMWQALYAQSQLKEAGGYMWGLVSGQSNIITAIAMVLGGLIVSKFSFESLFIIMGIIQLIATIYQARILQVQLAPIIKT